MRVCRGEGLEVKQYNESVYDFHEDGDSDDREPPGLMIDETPRRKSSRQPQAQDTLKIKLTGI